MTEARELLRIRRNRIVHLALEVTHVESGRIIENASEHTEHFIYLHGHGNLIPQIESELQGMRAGDRFDVTVANAYGAYHPDAVRTLMREDVSIPDGTQVGDTITTRGPNGYFELRLRAIDDTSITVDANHPLAGQTLRYAGLVLKVLKAHKDEIRHHRPHPAGHHLMVQDSSFQER